MCSFCLESSLNQTKARGKVLVCRQAGRSSESKLAKSTAVKNAGGVGMILIDELDQDIAVPFTIPAATVGKRAGDRIFSYINRTRSDSSAVLHGVSREHPLIESWVSFSGCGWAPPQGAEVAHLAGEDDHRGPAGPLGDRILLERPELVDSGDFEGPNYSLRMNYFLGIGR